MFKKQKPKAVKAEEKRQWTWIKEVAIPYLIEHSKSIIDAENIVNAASVALQHGFDRRLMEEQTRWSKELLSNLGLEEMMLITKDNEFSRGFLKLLSDEPVSNARSLITNTYEAIKALKKSEMLTRTLGSLNLDKLE